MNDCRGFIPSAFTVPLTKAGNAAEPGLCFLFLTGMLTSAIIASLIKTHTSAEEIFKRGTTIRQLSNFPPRHVLAPFPVYDQKSDVLFDFLHLQHRLAFESPVLGQELDRDFPERSQTTLIVVRLELHPRRPVHYDGPRGLDVNVKPLHMRSAMHHTPCLTPMIDQLEVSQKFNSLGVAYPFEGAQRCRVSMATLAPFL
jgi:hypothetical protein